ncbi:MAG: peptide deformylase [Alphaproteobacteria bacterium]
MTILPIIEVPDPRLKLKAAPVDRVDAAVVRLMDDMLETMYVAPGIGLAAPQVGVARRIIVVDLADKDEPRRPLRMVNPEVVWASEDLCVYSEGCLSVPEQFADVERPERIRVRYIDHHGAVQEIDADGLLATVLQHEIDHLEGILFLDHLSKLKRDMLVRRVQKARKGRQTEAL